MKFEEILTMDEGLVTEVRGKPKGQRLTKKNKKFVVKHQNY
jgi:hypothetical protein